MKSFNKYFESLYNVNKWYSTVLFSTECSIYYSSDEKDLNCEKATVQWGIVLNDDKSGIYDINLIIKSVECEIVIEEYNENDQIIKEDTEILIFETDIEVERNWHWREDSDKFKIEPDEIEIHYDDKKCKVVFN